KSTLIPAILCLLAAAMAQENAREVCRRVNERCLRSAGNHGPNNDISNIFNEWCRRQNRNWRNISRCELTRATCRLTLERCRSLSCENVRDALRP
ncbi:hypothetical protein KR074_012315, partial [Drosophila pseudoananassae]